MTPPAHTGLREAHAHIAEHGRAMSTPRLEGCGSAAECLGRVEDAAAAAPPGAWVILAGARAEAWRDTRWPSAPELETASGRRPCIVWSFDHHALVASSSALAAAGIDRAGHATTPDPPGGRIVRDAQGRATGLLLEAAARLVWAAVPEPSPAQFRGYVRAAVHHLASLGYVEVHDLLSGPRLGPILAELEDAGELPLSVRLYPPLDRIDQEARAAREWERPRVRLAGAKAFTDGTLNSRTAWLLEPYRDPLPGLERGQALMQPAEIAFALERVAAMGLGLAAHAIGDGAVGACLDAFEMFMVRAGRAGSAVRRDAGPVRVAGRWTRPRREPPPRPAEDEPPRPVATEKPLSVPLLRIEHAEIVDAADVDRFARLGVVCSVQPCHLLADIEVLTKALPRRLDRVLPLRDLIDSGCRPGELLWFGSDTPIVRPEPQDSILAATARRRADMPPESAVGLRQAITQAEARQAFEARPES